MNAVKWIVPAAAVEAAVTGLILIVSPSLFAWLILGTKLSLAGYALGRLAGIAMIGAGLAAWWPFSTTVRSTTAAVPGFTIYNLFATIYLAYLGIAGQLVGILLWPAVALHAVLLILLGRHWLALGSK
ncbi:MAG TPA: hypothetical protein VEK31_00250 [Xanthobacteraceae bacterium]|nr:hypothetical protein [Xanthobacteraceae bacterium]